jgi:hypothetical protein
MVCGGGEEAGATERGGRAELKAVGVGAGPAPTRPGVGRSGQHRRGGGAAGVALERSCPVRALVGSSEEMGHAFQGP